MLDHISIRCADLTTSAAFYDAVFEPLGARRVLESGNRIGYGAEFPAFRLGPLETGDRSRETHIAFTGPTRAAVIAFRDAAGRLGAEVLHNPVCGPNTIPAPSDCSFAIPTGTMSKPSITPGRRRPEQRVTDRRRS